LGFSQSAMPKPAPMPPPPPPFSPLDALKDVFLFQGDFKWCFYLSLVLFCAANARAILTATPKINYFHGCALMVLVCYGGSTMSAIMVGESVAFVCNEALVPCCLATWTAMYLMPGAALSFVKDSSVGVVVTMIGYEIQRCHVLMNCTKQAAAILPTKLAQPAASRVAIVGPLIGGLLGGCGGGFMPLNKGLEPLANGTNWRILSAAMNSLWMFFSTQYAPTKEIIGLSVEWSRFCAVAFFVSLPLLCSALGIDNPLGANPLAAPKASADKKKK